MLSKEELTEKIAEAIWNRSIEQLKESGYTGDFAPWDKLGDEVKKNPLLMATVALQALLSSLPDNEDKTLEDIGNLRGYYKQLLSMKDK